MRFWRTWRKAGWSSGSGKGYKNTLSRHSYSALTSDGQSKPLINVGACVNAYKRSPSSVRLTSNKVLCCVSKHMFEITEYNELPSLGGWVSCGGGQGGEENKERRTLTCSHRAESHKHTTHTGRSPVSLKNRTKHKPISLNSGTRILVVSLH